VVCNEDEIAILSAGADGVFQTADDIRKPRVTTAPARR